MNDLERRTVTYHETGHGLVALSLPSADAVHKVSIVPRGIGALGCTIQRPTEDRFLMTREELGDKIAVLLGGRAAESLVFETLSTGAADDLTKATDIARTMVTRYGMDDALGNVAYEAETRPFLEPMPGLPAVPRSYSEKTAQDIDAAVRSVIDAAYRRAGAILAASRAVLERGAALLLEQETPSGDDIRALLEATEPPGGKRKEPGVA